MSRRAWPVKSAMSSILVFASRLKLYVCVWISRPVARFIFVIVLPPGGTEKDFVVRSSAPGKLIVPWASVMSMTR